MGGGGGGGGRLEGVTFESVFSRGTNHRGASPSAAAASTPSG